MPGTERTHGSALCPVAQVDVNNRNPIKTQPPRVQLLRELPSGHLPAESATQGELLAAACSCAPLWQPCTQLQHRSWKSWYGDALWELMIPPFTLTPLRRAPTVSCFRVQLGR